MFFLPNAIYYREKFGIHVFYMYIRLVNLEIKGLILGQFFIMGPAVNTQGKLWILDFLII